MADREAAADATSQVFAKAIVALPRYRHDSFRSWLFTIAHNVIVDATRRRRPQLPLDAATEVVDVGVGPEEYALSAEERESVEALLAQLPTDQRRVVELRLAGLTGPEIADVLGRSVQAIKSIQFRAYARLRRLLELNVDRGRGTTESHDAWR